MPIECSEAGGDLYPSQPQSVIHTKRLQAIYLSQHLEYLKEMFELFVTIRPRRMFGGYDLFLLHYPFFP